MKRSLSVIILLILCLGVGEVWREAASDHRARVRPLSNSLPVSEIDGAPVMPFEQGARDSTPLWVDARAPSVYIPTYASEESKVWAGEMGRPYGPGVEHDLVIGVESSGAHAMPDHSTPDPDDSFGSSDHDVGTLTVIDLSGAFAPFPRALNPSNHVPDDTPTLVLIALAFALMALMTRPRITP